MNKEQLRNIIIFIIVIVVLYFGSQYVGGIIDQRKGEEISALMEVTDLQLAEEIASEINRKGKQERINNHYKKGIATIGTIMGFDKDLDGNNYAHIIGWDGTREGENYQYVPKKMLFYCSTVYAGGVEILGSMREGKFNSSNKYKLFGVVNYIHTTGTSLPGFLRSFKDGEYHPYELWLDDCLITAINND